MPDNDKKGSGLSTTMVVCIGVGAFALGAIATGCAYEFIFIPEANQKSKAPAAGAMTTQAGSK